MSAASVSLSAGTRAVSLHESSGPLTRRATGHSMVTTVRHAREAWHTRTGSPLRAGENRRTGTAKWSKGRLHEDRDGGGSARSSPLPHGRPRQHRGTIANRLLSQAKANTEGTQSLRIHGANGRRLTQELQGAYRATIRPSHMRTTAGLDARLQHELCTGLSR